MDRILDYTPLSVKNFFRWLWKEETMVVVVFGLALALVMTSEYRFIRFLVAGGMGGFMTSLIQVYQRRGKAAITRAAGFKAEYDAFKDKLKADLALAVEEPDPWRTPGSENFKVGDRVTHWSERDVKPRTLYGTYRGESGVYVVVEFDAGQDPHYTLYPRQCVYASDLRLLR